MKRQIPKILMIALQFIFYLFINKIFKVSDRVMYNTFFIYLALNFTKNMYSFRTILIWEELKKQLLVHIEYLIIMLINDLAFWGKQYALVHLTLGINAHATKAIKRFLFMGILNLIAMPATSRFPRKNRRPLS